ncbi:Lrp/AsnC family transcriptional regulator [Streptomyces sp. UH6]|uniref:Lrp/AsnC family transcriptional regulator n=1 Tax=Streptomyces sp. UH6 TaxID=2748379 RepID=UPI0015D49F05|nr:Lrp/AsnC family transcriptional regulator [Streptomyces sp. UH6]NYV72909.1 Lrp/AsnC family transcriptional regulator [Streptomyces sp. UH6]
MDDLDLMLVNALQINPRISWADLSGALHVDATTLSRRWDRLIQGRLAWTRWVYTPHFARDEQPHVDAIAEVRCEPGTREEVIRALVANPLVSGVHCTSGDRDLFATVHSDSIGDLDAAIQQVIASARGVTAITTTYIRTLFQEGSSWRLPALGPGQLSAVDSTLPRLLAPSAPTQLHLALIDSLAWDVRRPVADVAREVGASRSRVARALQELLVADWARARVDIAFRAAGWKASALMWMRVPPGQLQRVAAAIRTLPYVRMCASVSGRSNLVVTLLLHEVRGLDDLEPRIVNTFPGVTIEDTWVVPRVAKLFGVAVDPDGRVSPDDAHVFLKFARSTI